MCEQNWRTDSPDCPGWYLVTAQLGHGRAVVPANWLSSLGWGDTNGSPMVNVIGWQPLPPPMQPSEPHP